MKEYTCCFAGHQKLPIEKIEQIVMNLNYELERLIQHGVKTFISGGVRGFDQIATSLIVAKKQMGRDIRLIFALPYKNHEQFWSTSERQFYHKLLAEADEVIYVSEQYTDDCIEKHNCYMVVCSAYCICAMLRSHTGTAQTVKYARQEGLQIFNVAENKHDNIVRLF